MADAHEAGFVVPAERVVSGNIAAADAQVVFCQRVRQFCGRPRTVQHAAQTGDARRYRGAARLIVVQHGDGQIRAGSLPEQRLQYFDVVREGFPKACRNVSLGAFDASRHDVVVVGEAMEDIGAQKVPIEAQFFRGVNQARGKLELHFVVPRFLQVRREAFQHVVVQQGAADEKLVEMRFLFHEDRRPFIACCLVCLYSRAFAVRRQ